MWPCWLDVRGALLVVVSASSTIRIVDTSWKSVCHTTAGAASYDVCTFSHLSCGAATVVSLYCADETICSSLPFTRPSLLISISNSSRLEMSRKELTDADIPLQYQLTQDMPHSAIASHSKPASIDRRRDRYPFCLVWGPLPLITSETRPSLHFRHWTAPHCLIRSPVWAGCCDD